MLTLNEKLFELPVCEKESNYKFDTKYNTRGVALSIQLTVLSQSTTVV